MIEDAFDPYAVIRNAYLDRREYQVRDGDVDAEDLEFEDWPEDEVGVGDAPAPAD
jgi:ABC-type transporter lipoprotein component MlaA